MSVSSPEVARRFLAFAKFQKTQNVVPRMTFKTAQFSTHCGLQSSTKPAAMETDKPVIDQHNEYDNDVSSNDDVGFDINVEDGASIANVSSVSSVSEGARDNENSCVRDVEIILAKEENRMIDWYRICFLAILAIATVVMAVVTYRFTKSAEREDVKMRFDDFARQVIEVSKINSQNIQKVFGTMGLQATTQAIGSGQKWPFVHLPEFEAQSINLIDNSGVEFVALAVLVTEEQRLEYEDFTVANQDWIEEGFQFSGNDPSNIRSIVPRIFNDRNNLTLTELSEMYAPIWQNAPIERGIRYVNFDAIWLPFFRIVFDKMIESRRSTISAINSFNYEGLLPASYMSQPIFETNEPGAKIVAFVTSQIRWHQYFVNLLPEGIDGIVIVVRNTLDQAISYHIRGPSVEYLGEGDFHDPAYDSYEYSNSFTTFQTVDGCDYTFNVYPTKDFEDTYLTNNPIHYTVAVVCIFVLTTLSFFIYDLIVKRRQVTVITRATRSNAIVNSPSPSNVRDRLMEEAVATNEDKKEDAFNNRLIKVGPTLIEGVNGNGTNSPFGSQPIADHWECATVMFADISGFTKWSSSRKPAQIFQLLEAIYNCFDDVANHHGVFKVETIGDCYIAVCGLPEPCKDHAIVMCRFARDCMTKMNQLAPQLEPVLGLGTSDLCMRFGLHSGPVTAGVLRSEKSRFQLLGDTVNKAARMESTGQRNRIQVSQETADLLVASGKSHWTQAREGFMARKGKGNLQTYWVNFGSGSTVVSKQNLSNATTANEPDATASYSESERLSTEALALDPDKNNQKQDRLANWNGRVLESLLRKVVAMRSTTIAEASTVNEVITLAKVQVGPKNVIEEFQDAIAFVQEPFTAQDGPADISVESKAQLYKFISKVASLYWKKPCPFHSFEHATHVMASTIKLVSRISYNPGEPFTLGISSDPLTAFSLAFAALIHDADHPGVPNSQLVKEDGVLAKGYRYKSIAEQNSINSAWTELMKDDYAALRACIYTNQAEHDRFRQIVVNSILATDIMDKGHNVMRKQRWEALFGSTRAEKKEEEDGDDGVADRKATLVLEHLLQAADVSHTMQHWQVFSKWNERLFEEMYAAFLVGRADSDPSRTWYDRELGFFDYFVIPLAQKLKDSNAFGAAGDECLKYARTNRNEWAQNGHKIVATYLGKYLPDP